MRFKLPAPYGPCGPRQLWWRTAFAFCAPLAVNGIALPYFPVWLRTLDYSDYEIGVILALPLIVRILSAPAIGLIAGRVEDRSTILLWSGGLSLMTAVALFFTTGFWPVLLVYCLQTAAYSPYLPVVDSLAITGARRFGLDYAAMRGVGSAAFVVSTLGAGVLIGIGGGTMVLPAMTFGFCLTVLMGLYAPHFGKAPPPQALAAGTKRGELRQSFVQLMMIGAAIVNSAHGMLYAFASIYWSGIGFSGAHIGVLWAIGVVAEIVVFFLGALILRRFNAWTLMRFGAAVAVCRWLIFPVPMGFSGYFLLQIAHAFSFAMVHLGIQRKILETVQEHQEASAQGTYFFYTGLFLAISTYLSGVIFTRFGVTGFYAMAVIASIGLGLIITAYYLQPVKLRAGNH